MQATQLETQILMPLTEYLDDENRSNCKVDSSSSGMGRAPEHCSRRLPKPHGIYGQVAIASHECMTDQKNSNQPKRSKQKECLEWRASNKRIPSTLILRPRRAQTASGCFISALDEEYCWPPRQSSKEQAVIHTAHLIPHVLFCRVDLDGNIVWHALTRQ